MPIKLFDFVKKFDITPNDVKNLNENLSKESFYSIIKCEPMKEFEKNVKSPRLLLHKFYNDITIFLNIDLNHDYVVKVNADKNRNVSFHLGFIKQEKDDTLYVTSINDVINNAEIHGFYETFYNFTSILR